jgi:aspartyl-tRNA(Asn)/glutamyl-tRNA(Gln) amidotransferase subunit A
LPGVGTLNEHDSNDPTSIRPEYRQTSDRHHGLKKLRIGVPVECFPSELSQPSFAPLRQAISELRSHFHVEIVSVSVPSTIKALSAYYTIASAEASSNLARYDGIRYGFRSQGETVEQTRTESFGGEVKKRIILGTYALTAE